MSGHLERLLEQATPGPWGIEQVQHHWNDYSYRVAGGHHSLPDAALIARAPDTTRLLIDMAAEFKRLLNGAEPDCGEDDCVECWPDRQARAIYARFAALDTEGT